MVKRGRPSTAAQSLEQALQAVANGTAPKRARNDFERMAGGRTRGRRPSATSPTRVAAELAQYLMSSAGLSQADAVRQVCAAAVPKPDASNVRKYLHRMTPLVLCAHGGKGLFSGFPVPASERLPLLANVTEVTGGIEPGTGVATAEVE